MEFVGTIKAKCSMLIDQELYIDDDPIGHTCYNDAEYCDGVHYYCTECYRKISNGDNSVKKPPFNSVEMWSKFSELVQSGKKIIM